MSTFISLAMRAHILPGLTLLSMEDIHVDSRLKIEFNAGTNRLKFELSMQFRSCSLFLGPVITLLEFSNSCHTTEKVIIDILTCRFDYAAFV